MGVGCQEPTYESTKQPQCPSVFDGTDGWDGWDGLDGLDGISKVSFKILHTMWVYRLSIYLLIHEKKKLSPTFLWVSKFDIKLGVGEHDFRNYHIYVTFQIFGSKSRYFWTDTITKRNV